MDKKKLYEQIMTSVAKEVKKILNENRVHYTDPVDDILFKFRKNGGMGVTGDSLDTIAKYIYEKLGNVNVKINLPYSKFNVKGDAELVMRDTVNAMPFAVNHENLRWAETFYYGDNQVTDPCHTFLPFLSDADVYFIDDYFEEDGYHVFNLIKAPSWRTYL